MAIDPRGALLLIPDISGYTEFVNSVEITHAGHIISNLLETVIEENRLGLTLSEIEGDALLFYRPGAPPSLEEVREQVDRWFVAFHSRLNLMKRDTYCECGACNFIPQITLKVVGHYGPVGLQRIGGHTKLIGRDVVLVHRLLKNTVRIDEYLFITKTLYEATGAPPLEDSDIVTCEEEYPVFGNVSMIFFSLKSLHDRVPPAPEREAIPPHDIEIREEVAVGMPLEPVARFLTNIENQRRWIADLREFEMDTSQPLHSGQHHLCVLGDMTVHQNLDRIEETSDSVRIVIRNRPPMWIIKTWYAIHEARREGDRTRVSVSMAFTFQPATRWMFHLMMERRLRKMVGQSIRNLKDLLEALPSGGEQSANTEPPMHNESLVAAKGSH